MTNDPEATATTFKVTVWQRIDEGTPSVEPDELEDAISEHFRNMHDIESIRVKRI